MSDATEQAERESPQRVLRDVRTLMGRLDRPRHDTGVDWVRDDLLPILRRIEPALAASQARVEALEKALHWRQDQASRKGRGAWSSVERLLDAIASDDAALAAADVRWEC